MANEWEVRVDTDDGVKRFVRIHDIPNKRFYENYFPTGESNNKVDSFFTKKVKAHRKEIADKAALELDLTNFEQGL